MQRKKGMFSLSVNQNQSVCEADKRKSAGYICAVFAVMILGIVLTFVTGLQEVKLLRLDNLFAFLLAAGAVAYLYFFERDGLNLKKVSIICLLIVISVLCILVTDVPMLYSFWSIGGFFLLGIYGMRFGMFLNFCMFFLSGSHQNVISAETICMQVAVLLILGFLLPKVKKWCDTANLLMACGGAVCAIRLLFYVFYPQKIQNNNLFWIGLSYFVIICGIFLLRLVLEKTEASQNLPGSIAYLESIAKEDVSEKKDFENVTMHLSSQSKETVPVVYDEFCKEDSPLLIKLQNASQEAYLHSKRVASLAKIVAGELKNADVSLVYAAGLYHEIGRILGKNTLENTDSVAKKEKFPKGLREVLSDAIPGKSHPKSAEAGIVLLTDNICSTIEYLKKSTNQELLFERIVDKSLLLRMNKGDLNDCGFSVQDFSAIRNCLVRNLKEDLF